MKHIRLSFLALAAGLVVGVSAAQAQRLQDRGSQDEQKACTPDVFRLCLSAIPNEPEIVSCLRRSMAQLSPDCRSVMQGKPTKAVKRTKEPPRSATSGRGPH
ncbi:hypothetical protein GJW-30_1_04453 [Variibacter gotjawalensis]|uniref:Cysteine rich repeat protein n=1 Tax=Variibacter gotjawalensis TaxID=1333996 RepID=A0A0S3Q178_9BRAD|nr:hypothetical protein [Variibacter gotjawalensis]NIK47738.1 hypothetical protein [Variibacter gotjawalensis]RZS49627.1 hypothetical protein EV661_2065 [Variibacter gotjawalensis]BAT61891.1 hypothetical protein GJW-30_1_04453 [Variibacter gotjawalensis]